MERYGAFDISLVADLPLFVDPFLLFSSRRPAYRQLHKQIIEYLTFLRGKASNEHLTAGLIKSWYAFKEVKETWLGFSQSGNQGAGLGPTFAIALQSNLNDLFRDFGQDDSGGRGAITKGNHLEKLCLIEKGVGRDKISDFTTRLILHYLCEYTEKFTRQYLRQSKRKRFTVLRTRFDYRTETWRPGTYTLPNHQGTFVLLVPADLLTRDNTWINKTELIDQFEALPMSVGDEELRAQVENYFRKVLGPPRRRRKIRKVDRDAAARKTILQFPQLIDYYIRRKEDTSTEAVSVSRENVKYSGDVFGTQAGTLMRGLAENTGFYALAGNTYEEGMQRLVFLKEEIEERGGWRYFYRGGKPIERESDIHLLYKLVWFASVSDVNPEANSGRGPVDFTVSRGSADKTIVEFKLAKNSQLKRNLERQVKVYKKSSRAQRTITAIVYFTYQQWERVQRVLRDLKLERDPSIVLIDAQKDNKVSGSRA